MPTQPYRIVQIPNWSGGWDVVRPFIEEGLAKLGGVIAHCHNIPQKPTDIRVRAGWLEVVFSDRLDPAMEDHLGISP